MGTLLDFACFSVTGHWKPVEFCLLVLLQAWVMCGFTSSLLILWCCVFVCLFFIVDLFLKSLLNLFCVLGFWPPDLQAPSSTAEDQTHTACTGRPHLSRCTARERPVLSFLFVYLWGWMRKFEIWCLHCPLNPEVFLFFTDSAQALPPLLFEVSHLPCSVFATSLCA